MNEFWGTLNYRLDTCLEYGVDVGVLQPLLTVATFSWTSHVVSMAY